MNALIVSAGVATRLLRIELFVTQYSESVHIKIIF